jgi:hypothetical protein
MLAVLTVAPQARDCSVSKEFRIRSSQVLAGVLEDPLGAALSGIELGLLSPGKVVQYISTDNQGRYDFGEVPAGRYKIHVKNGAGVLCAPKIKCGTNGCSLNPKLTLNPKNMVQVD